MSSDNAIDELLRVANDPDASETGGGHNQKGVDFQRYWAVLRMFQLELAASKDFLVLFESIQDVAELDSCASPTRITVFQIKKRDRKEWSWTDLTGLPAINARAKPSAAADPTRVAQSPIGKLFASIISFDNLISEGRFVSNAGCDVPLAGDSNAATSLPCGLERLSLAHIDSLNQALVGIYQGRTAPDLSRVLLEKSPLPPDSLNEHSIGVIFQFLSARSPRHATQAKALLDALLTQIAALGRKTATCMTFDDLKRERGYSRADFVAALATLEEVPDLLSLMEQWLTQLAAEGVDAMSITRIRVAAARIFRSQLLGARTVRDRALEMACEKHIETAPPKASLRIFLDESGNDLRARFPDFREHELHASLLLGAIQKCVDQI